MNSLILLLALAVTGCNDGKDGTDTADISGTDDGTTDNGTTDNGGVADDTGPTGGDDTGPTGADDTGPTGSDDTGVDTDDSGDSGDSGDTGPEDSDGDGYSADEDCDDSDATVNPGAEETPYDGVDNDCDESTLDDDLDEDGFGEADDCDDLEEAINPDAEEVCDGADNNCDGEIDEDSAIDAGTWYGDTDGDGFGDSADVVTSCEAPKGYVEYDGDCDDDDTAFNPGATEDDCADPSDYNCDGSVGYEDLDGDGYAACDDCDDGDITINPDGTEVCDGADNNCDGVIDDDAIDQSTWYADADGDGFGDRFDSVEDCYEPSGYTDNPADCDDDPITGPDVNPDEDEVCNGIDDNCDGVVDTDAIDQSTYYADSDEDGYGDAASTLEACEEPEGYTTDSDDCDDSDGALNLDDLDGDGFSTCDDDCDDSVLTGAASNPDEDEVCDDLDNDCDDSVDEDATDALTFYADGDEDGEGDAASTLEACSTPEGYVANSTDCDDSDAALNTADSDADGFSTCDDDCDDATGTTYPGADETCNDTDDDCDVSVDEDPIDPGEYYADSDEDGYGDPGSTIDACEAPDGYTDDSDDCDDSDGAVNPDADEIWYDGTDQDCAGDDDYDQDGDGDYPISEGGEDCDDTDPTRYGGEDCRPDADCTHPSTATVDASVPTGIVDVVFDDECNAYLTTIISGLDYTYVMDSTGSYSTVNGYSNYNQSAVALDPVTGDIVVAHNDNSTSAVGVEVTSISRLAVGTYSAGSLWSSNLLNQCQSAIAVDTDGCIWAPNFAGSGTLVCVDITTGSQSTVLSLSDRIQAVALATDETVLIAVGPDILEVSGSTTSTVFAGTDDIFDFAVDYNDDLYLETTAGELVHWDVSEGAATAFISVSGEGKLTITPDGYLFRTIPAPTGYADYEEWELPD